LIEHTVINTHAQATPLFLCKKDRTAIRRVRGYNPVTLQEKRKLLFELLKLNIVKRIDLTLWGLCGFIHQADLMLKLRSIDRPIYRISGVTKYLRVLYFQSSQLFNSKLTILSSTCISIITTAMACAMREIQVSSTADIIWLHVCTIKKGNEPTLLVMTTPASTSKHTEWNHFHNSIKHRRYIDRAYNAARLLRNIQNTGHVFKRMIQAPLAGSTVTTMLFATTWANLHKTHVFLHTCNIIIWGNHTLGHISNQTFWNI
jgi:hypothetical protein